ncbi:MAG: SDR family oxidoreductase, partial [Ignavibacteriaceae bacterium]|nr:SDR family oxidoreductase [Ignavibacteriaceae bacterium]
TLKSKIVFITGASSGIGRACAIEFAKEGANLILAARRIERLTELAETLRTEYTVKIKTVQLDVRDKNMVQSVISFLPDEWKTIDVLVNNAGLARGFDKLHDGNTDDWDEMIDTNIKGLLFVTKYVLPFMIKNERGHIINIGSTAGHEVYPKGNVYAATKFAVNALTQSIRLDVLDKNIKVTAVDPGMVETEFSLVRFTGDEDKAAGVYKGIIPLTPEDVASAVVFCASRPPHVNINELIITPSAQASSTQVYRK